ncbi:MAG TPA: hypothetical protein VIH86_07985, partial [Puia sp.]
VFRLNIILIILNGVVFFLSMGRYNLLDRIFGIRTVTIKMKSTELSFPFIANTFAALMIISMGVTTKFQDLFSFSTLIVKTQNTFTEIHFPVEAFDGCVNPHQINYRIEKTNLIITPSDPTSLIFNRLLLQRQLEARITDSLVTDPKKRAELCYDLIGYCQGIVSLIDTNNQIMQTKIVLVHMDYYAPYLAKESDYVYYFDDKKPEFGIHGGFPIDSLNIYYLQTRRNINDTIAKFLSSKTGRTFEEIQNIIRDGNVVKFIQTLTPNIQNELKSMNMLPTIDKRLWNISLVPFSKVKPLSTLVISFPTAMYQLFGNSFYETQFVGAAITKNNLFHEQR